MKRFILSVALTLLLFLCSVCPALAGTKGTDPGELYAKAACLLDGDSGRLLYGKEADAPLPMASTTKIMTCILALEEGDPEAEVTASKEAAAQPKVHLGVREGERFRLEDLLYSMMLESHNDAAWMVAEGVGGSAERFAERMNAKAREIGCTDTHFVTPNGLDGSDGEGEHHTTARDLALILRYCIRESEKAEQFLAITRTPSYSFWDLEQEEFYNCSNHNAFLSMMDGALTGKTGFTAKAGYCYVGALERDGRCYVAALLACGWPNNRSYKWSDMRKLMDYGLSNYEYRDLLDHGWRPGEVPVTEGQNARGLTDRTGTVGLVSPVMDPGRELPLLAREDEQPEISAELPETLTAPVKKGDVVGRITYALGGEILAEYPVYAAGDVKRVDFLWCLTETARRFLLKNV